MGYGSLDAFFDGENQGRDVREVPETVLVDRITRMRVSFIYICVYIYLFFSWVTMY